MFKLFSNGLENESAQDNPGNCTCRCICEKANPYYGAGYADGYGFTDFYKIPPVSRNR